ncbi:unnamed protein product [Phytomonas sp. Hart1]|nr:unnamed protein product [Phytomonas sp. Hart1]|eukprot:CCW71685.1 unnamed protein product [Phytomonas sp. isolate Hart1]
MENSKTSKVALRFRLSRISLMAPKRMSLLAITTATVAVLRLKLSLNGVISTSFTVCAIAKVASRSMISITVWTSLP